LTKVTHTNDFLGKDIFFLVTKQLFSCQKIFFFGTFFSARKNLAATFFLQGKKNLRQRKENVS